MAAAKKLFKCTVCDDCQLFFKSYSVEPHYHVTGECRLYPPASTKQGQAAFYPTVKRSTSACAQGVPHTQATLKGRQNEC